MNECGDRTRILICREEKGKGQERERGLYVERIVHGTSYLAYLTFAQTKQRGRELLT